MNRRGGFNRPLDFIAWDYFYPQYRGFFRRFDIHNSFYTWASYVLWDSRSWLWKSWEHSLYIYYISNSLSQNKAYWLPVYIKSTFNFQNARIMYNYHSQWKLLKINTFWILTNIKNYIMSKSIINYIGFIHVM